jgi:sugar-specific transcriptional regulator TrmB
MSLAKALNQISTTNMFNISEKEKKVMSSLYKFGDASVSEIARETLINRTSVYPILKKLLDKGLVSQYMLEEKTMYKPIPLQDFKDWTDRKKKTVNTQVSALLKWIDSQKANKKASLHSEISYFEGHEGVMSLYNDTLRNNKQKQINAIVDYDAAMNVLGDYFTKEYFPGRLKNSVNIRALMYKSKKAAAMLSKSKQLLREVRFIDLFENLQTEINIYDDKIAIISFDKAKPSGVIIKNEIMAMTFQHIYEYLWKSVK